MAVSALPRTHARASGGPVALGPSVLFLALLASAVDLLALVQPVAMAPLLGTAAAAGAGAVLLLGWARYPRTSWLAAASLASFASVAMRLVGADVAPVLSLLTIVALGLGGAFTSSSIETDALLGT